MQFATVAEAACQGAAELEVASAEGQFVEDVCREVRLAGLLRGKCLAGHRLLACAAVLRSCTKQC